jgi:oleandomycin transport system ATP-binding protein
VRSLVADGSTVVLTTQYLEEADALADDISVIDHGRVIAQGSPEELKRVVGGQTLTVRAADQARVADAARIVADVTGTAPERRRDGLLSVAVRGDEAMTRTVAQLATAGIAVTELSLHLPSLDEVFFSLTGRREGDPAEEAA